MINKLVYLLIAVVVIALIAFGIDYAMTTFAVGAMWQKIVWFLFGFLILLGIIGLFGYGPFADSMKSP